MTATRKRGNYPFSDPFPAADRADCRGGKGDYREYAKIRFSHSRQSGDGDNFHGRSFSVSINYALCSSGCGYKEACSDRGSPTG